MNELKVTTVGDLTAKHIGQIVSFETTITDAKIQARLVGEIREANHDASGTELWITSHTEDVGGDKTSFCLDSDHEITLEV